MYPLFCKKLPDVKASHLPLHVTQLRIVQDQLFVLDDDEKTSSVNTGKVKVVIWIDYPQVIGTS